MGDKTYLAVVIHNQRKNVFIMAQILRGTEKKFAINLAAPGFSMDDNDFEIEVVVGGESIKGYKTPEEGAPTDVLIFKETTTVTVEGSESSDSSSSASETEVSTWYMIVNTAAFTKSGDMKAVATAHIPDVNANDGIRNEVTKTALGTLANP